MPNWDKRPGVGEHSKDWPAIRKRVLARDQYKCQWLDNGEACGKRASTVDRIKPRYLGGTEDDDNCRSLCWSHHQRKSSSEGGSAKRRPSHYYSARPTEQHPGLRRRKER